MGPVGAAGFGARLLDGLGDPGRAEQVDLDGAVERRVEADSRGRVDDRVAAGEQGPAGGVEAEAVDATSPAIGSDPGGHLGVETVAELAP